MPGAFTGARLPYLTFLESHDILSHILEVIDMANVRQAPRFTFDTDAELGKMIEQRAKQEGITVSEYIPEAIILELFFSGDLDAASFVLKRVSKRIKGAMVDKLASIDLRERVEALVND